MSHERSVSPSDDRDRVHSHSYLFALRLWKADTPDGPEYRGSVRDVSCGAWRHFRDWSLARAFLIEQVEQHEHERQLREGEPMP